MSVQHFLTLKDLPAQELQKIIKRAIELKRDHKAGAIHEPLKHKVMGMLFEKSSTRTRVSFETAMIQLGGHAIFLLPSDTQLGRGEPVEDMARVLSRMVDVIMIRTYEHSKIETFAAHSSVPVINGLTDLAHPCQLLADVQTYIEHRGDIQGKKIAWIGDGNNMCFSYINAARQFDFELAISSPSGYTIDKKHLENSQGHATFYSDPMEATKNADMVVTDVWASMGQEQESHMRAIAFAPYQVTSTLMKQAKQDAVFMHCLPAHRGEEVTAEVIDGRQSVVWDEAENRLHAQKALLEYLLCH
jgi:ornithine carbamoyltransferase